MRILKAGQQLVVESRWESNQLCCSLGRAAGPSRIRASGLRWVALNSRRWEKRDDWTLNGPVLRRCWWFRAWWRTSTGRSESPSVSTTRTVCCTRRTDNGTSSSIDPRLSAATENLRTTEDSWATLNVSSPSFLFLYPHVLPSLLQTLPYRK